MTLITEKFLESFTPREKEAAFLLEGALTGDRNDKRNLIEGIAQSDLAAALSPSMQAIALRNYAERPKIWTSFAERNVLDNFLPQPYRNIDFGSQANVPPGYSGDTHVAGALPTVAEYAPYPTIGFTASSQSLKVKKSGENLQISWEAVVTDGDIGVLERVPSAFGRHAAGREDSEATKALVTPTGLNTGLFTGGTVIAPGATAPLTLANLENALDLISRQSYNGTSVQPASRYALVVPQSLEMTARNILAITNVAEETTSGSTVTSIERGNPVAGRVNLVVNEWITKINPSATAAWFLIPVPGTTDQNPPVLVNFLRGYETPELWVKDNAAYYLGGGKVPERRGSFDNDDYQIRVRHTATGGFLTSAGYIGTLGAAS